MRVRSLTRSHVGSQLAHKLCGTRTRKRECREVACFPCTQCTVHDTDREKHAGTSIGGAVREKKGHKAPKLQETSARRDAKLLLLSARALEGAETRETLQVPRTAHAGGEDLRLAVLGRRGLVHRRRSERRVRRCVHEDLLAVCLGQHDVPRLLCGVTVERESLHSTEVSAQNGGNRRRLWG